MPGRLHTVAFGPPATAVLTDLVQQAKAADPLAPVTVVVPSATAEVTLRREVAARLGGLVGVAFRSLPQVASALAGPGARGLADLPPIVVRAHIRAAVGASASSLSADPAVAASAATEDALAVTFAELAPLDEGARRAVAAADPLAAGVVDLFERFRRSAGLPPAADVAAAAAARADLAPEVVGRLIVFLPRRVRPAEAALLGALALRIPVDAVVGRTGDDQADVVADELVAALAPVLGPPRPVGPPPAPAMPTHLVRAPDPAEEAAVATRQVVAALTAGTPPERIAVLYRVRGPYLALLHAALDDAGVPHHAPTVTTLAQTVPGRVLAALLDVVAGGFRRADIARLWRAGPVLDPATGRRVPASRWDRLAREAGIGGGLDQWRSRLAQAVATRTGHLARSRPEALDPANPEGLDGRIEAWQALSAHVERLAADLRPPDEPTWAAWADWLRQLLAGYLHPSARTRQPEAFERVDALLATLPRLDDAVPSGPETPTLELLRRVLAPELDRPGPRGHGRFGHGVTVGRLVDAVGAHFDLVVVVGAADGQFPPAGAEDPLLADRARARAGGALARRGLRREEERRDLLAAFASAPARVLTAPRADPRDQRERQPAAWFVAAASHLAGRLVTTGELGALAGEPWFTDLPSFEAHPAAMAAPATPRELDLGDLLAEHAQVGDGPQADALAAGVVAAEHPALARGLTAAVARRAGRFDEWSGRVGPDPALVVDDTRPRSPTGLERYAVCPFRSFLAEHLRVGAIDDPTESELISPLDEGSLVHEILEAFIGEHPGKPPGEPWSDAERARLDEVAAAVIDRYEAEGRTGRPLLWGVRREQLRHQLRRVLDADERRRAEAGVSPVAVELQFGDDDAPPVAVTLANGRTIRFRGFADRVDVSPDGRRLVVYDYKTGSTSGYLGMKASIRAAGDLTANGTKLQLPIYALAARSRFPDAEEVHSYYWFIGRKNFGETIGGVVDGAVETRFREVLEIVVDGIEAGRFPANPGQETWAFGRWSFDHCSWCEYDRICASTRSEQWVRLRTAPELASYRDLADPDPPEPDPGEEAP